MLSSSRGCHAAGNPVFKSILTGSKGGDVAAPLGPKLPIGVSKERPSLSPDHSMTMAPLIFFFPRGLSFRQNFSSNQGCGLKVRENGPID